MEFCQTEITNKYYGEWNTITTTTTTRSRDSISTQKFCNSFFINRIRCEFSSFSIIFIFIPSFYFFFFFYFYFCKAHFLLVVVCLGKKVIKKQWKTLIYFPISFLQILNLKLKKINWIMDRRTIYSHFRLTEFMYLWISA